MANENLFENAGRLFFSRERIRNFEKELNAAGVNIAADSFAGYVSLNVIIITIFLTAIILLYQPVAEPVLSIAEKILGLPKPVTTIVILFLSFATVYVSTLTLIAGYLTMNAENRKNKLENELPDFLSLVSSNMKAGMTLDQAMWYSAKPEFGLLSTEIKSHIKSSFSGQSMEGTLDELSSRFQSRLFKRTILLLKQANATGGEITAVLERTADDVRNTIIMKKEIAASLVLYEIFVLFAAVVGTPFLFAVATKLISVFEKIAPQVTSIPTTGGGGVVSTFSSFKFAGPAISSTEFFWFSIPTIFVTAIISSFIVSVIRTGTRSQGVKYFPFVLVMSYLVYWLVTNTVDALFASLT